MKLLPHPSIWQIWLLGRVAEWDLEEEEEGDELDGMADGFTLRRIPMYEGRCSLSENEAGRHSSRILLHGLEIIISSLVLRCGEDTISSGVSRYGMALYGTGGILELRYYSVPVSWYCGITLLRYMCNAGYGMVLLIGIQSIINAQLTKKSR